MVGWLVAWLTVREYPSEVGARRWLQEHGILGVTTRKCVLALRHSEPPPASRPCRGSSSEPPGCGVVRALAAPRLRAVLWFAVLAFACYIALALCRVVPRRPAVRRAHGRDWAQVVVSCVALVLAAHRPRVPQRGRCAAGGGGLSGQTVWRGEQVQQAGDRAQDAVPGLEQGARWRARSMMAGWALAMAKDSSAVSSISRSLR